MRRGYRTFCHILIRAATVFGDALSCLRVPHVRARWRFYGAMGSRGLLNTQPEPNIVFDFGVKPRLLILNKKKKYSIQNEIKPKSTKVYFHYEQTRISETKLPVTSVRNTVSIALRKLGAPDNLQSVVPGFGRTRLHGVYSKADISLDHNCSRLAGQSMLTGVKHDGETYMVPPQAACGRESSMRAWTPEWPPAGNVTGTVRVRGLTRGTFSATSRSCHC